MDTSCSLLDVTLLKLFEPKTTPKKALQFLTSSCLAPEAYKKGDKEPVLIFIAYINFLMKRRPSAIVNGIWEVILRKIVFYSRKFTRSQIKLKRNNLTPGPAYGLVDQLGLRNWLEKALSVDKNCPNPYTRLELFRLIRIFFRRDSSNMYWARLSHAFISTIAEIQPHHLYPSDNEEILFDLRDINYMVAQCCRWGQLQKYISNDIVKQLQEKKEIFDYSNSVKFICHLIQLIRVYAVMAASISDPKKSMSRINYGTVVFQETIGSLVNCQSHLPVMPLWNQFLYVVYRQPFRPYIIETVHELTSAIVNNRYSDMQKRMTLLSLRDIIAAEVVECTSTKDLPRLLLSRQVSGSTNTLGPYTSMISVPWVFRNMPTLLKGYGYKGACNVDNGYGEYTFYDDGTINHSDDRDSDQNEDEESDDSDHEERFIYHRDYTQVIIYDSCIYDSDDDC